jgi:hypothetical protein
MPTIFSMSLRSPRHGGPAATLMLLVLSVFLFGTNYCLFAAFGGARIACHAAVATAAQKPASCCHGGAAQDSPKPDSPTSEYPCCIQVAPPASLDLIRPDVDHAWFAVLDGDLESASTSFAADYVPDRRAAPPPETFPDLQRGRAPPLS